MSHQKKIPCRKWVDLSSPSHNPLIANKYSQYTHAHTFEDVNSYDVCLQLLNIDFTNLNGNIAWDK